MSNTRTKTTYQRGKELVEVQGIYLISTEKSDLIDFPEKVTPIFLPHSQYGRPLRDAIDTNVVGAGSDVIAIIPRWLADKNSLSYEEYERPEEEEGEDLPEAEWDDRDAYAKMMSDKGEQR